MRLLAALLIPLLAPAAAAQCGVLEFDSSWQGDPGEQIGTAVAATDDWLVVGARSSPNGIEYAGGARIYQRTPDGWAFRQLITASDADEGDEFGNAVAIDGTTLVVAASREDDGCDGAHWCDSGAAYVFELGPSGWVETAKLIASDSELRLELGTSVAISGDTIVAGAPGPGWGTGAAYVFERTPTGWEEVDKLVGSDVNPGEEFGDSVDVDGDTIVVATWGHDMPTSLSGGVWVFGREATGWVEELKLQAGDVGQTPGFGSSLDLRGDRMFVGSMGQPNGFNSTGAVFVYERTGGTWQEVDFFQPEPCSSAFFGEELTLGDDIAVVSSRCDTFVYSLIQSEWTEIFRLPIDPFAFGRGGFAFRGSELVVASPLSETDPEFAGTVWVFGVPQGTNYCTSLPNSTGAAAQIATEGCSGIAAEMLRLVASPVPDGFGFFFYGFGPMRAPYGNGLQCVTRPHFALPTEIVADGVLSHEIDYSDAPPSGAITAGSTWYFQALFRDRAAGGAGFDLSDGIEIPFVP